MIAIVTIAYVTLIMLIYKVFHVRPTPRNIASMIVLGVVMIGAIVILWKFSAPISNRLVVSRYTISIVPQVKGPITKMNAAPNVPLKAGKDILFQIQPDLYQNTVDQLTEALKAARRNVDQLEAGSIASDAAIKKAAANRAAAEAELEVARKTSESNADAISKLSLKQVTEKYNAAEAGLDEAKANAVQAKIGQQAAADSAQSLEAQLASAKFDLQQCTVYAPADGFVTNWNIRDGAMAVPLPLSPMGTFVDTSQVEIVASFPQNVLKHVQSGDPVELVFKTRPGEVYPATVETIIQASGEGQFAVSGTLPSAAQIGSKGMLAVKFQVKDPKIAKELAMGTAGVAAIYTDSGKPFHVISKVTIRINAWMYYLIPG